MNLNTNNKPVIERQTYCPYCKSEDAFLISSTTEQRTTLQIPDYGKKYWLCVLFTFGLYMLVHGFPMVEKKRTYEQMTYGFCPHCGKSYNAGVPASLKKAEQKKSKVYLSWKDKKVTGLCGGIAEYTGLSVKLVRFVTVLYCLFFIIPIAVYFICAALMETDPN